MCKGVIYIPVELQIFCVKKIEFHFLYIKNGIGNGNGGEDTKGDETRRI